MNWLAFWVIYIVIFLGVHYWIHRSHKARTKEIWDAHEVAIDKIMADHRVRMDEIFARNKK